MEKEKSSPIIFSQSNLEPLSGKQSVAPRVFISETKVTKDADANASQAPGTGCCRLVVSTTIAKKNTYLRLKDIHIQNTNKLREGKKLIKSTQNRSKFNTQTTTEPYHFLHLRWATNDRLVEDFRRVRKTRGCRK